MKRTLLLTLTAGAFAGAVAFATPAFAKGKDDATKAKPAENTQADVDDPLAKYFSALESMKLIDVESGSGGSPESVP